MQNLSDQDIDQLFRQAAEQNQSEFDPADWKIVANRLDRSARWLRLGKWFGSTTTVALLVTVGWLAVDYFTLDSQEAAALALSTQEVHQAGFETDDQREVVLATDSLAEDRAEVSHALSVAEETGGAGETENSPLVAGTREPDGSVSAPSGREKQIQQSESIDPGSQERAQHGKVTKGLLMKTRSDNSNTFKQKQRDSRLSISEEEVSKTPSTDNAALQLDRATKRDEESKAETGGRIVALEDGAKRTELSNPSEKETTPAGKNQINNRHTHVADSTEEIKIFGDSIAAKKELAGRKEMNADEKQSDSTREQSSFGRIGVKLKGSPDFSSENFKESGRAGFNYGIEVEYFATEHLSVSLGLIRSRKYYALHDAQYFNFVDLEIDGDCQMWDIPLNMNYYFSPVKNYSLFVNAGFSSYLMSEENYSFQVTTPGYMGDETQTYAQQVRGENQEWFKMVNISLGVQRRINRNFSLQVEPFVKIPLAEVGSANIALSSFGTYLLLRYNFLFNQK